MSLHDADILIIQPYAVSSNGWTGKKAGILDILKWPLAVLFPDFLDFRLGFGHVDMDIDTVLYRKLCCCLTEIRWAGIWCMNTQQNGDKPIPGTVVIFEQLHVVLQGLHSTRHEANGTTGQNATKACLNGHICY